VLTVLTADRPRTAVPDPCGGLWPVRARPRTRCAYGVAVRDRLMHAQAMLA